MKFKPGMLGACVVVMALLATVLAGYTLGGEEVTEYRTTYNNITSINGQFSYTEGSSYVTYNPAANYTGYDPAAISFTPTNTANQYPYISDLGSHITTELNLASMTSAHTISARQLTGNSQNIWMVGGTYATVAEVLSWAGINYQTIQAGITISLTRGDMWGFGSSSGLRTDSNFVLTSTGGNNYSSISGSGYIVHPDGTSQHYTDGSSWAWTTTPRPYTSNSDYTYTVSVSPSGECRVIWNGQTRDVSSATDVRLCWGGSVVYTSVGGGIPITGNGPFSGASANDAEAQVQGYNGRTVTSMITIDYDQNITREYMRIGDGIQILGGTVGDTVGWSNGYDLGSMTVAVMWEAGTTNRIQYQANVGTGWALVTAYQSLGNTYIEYTDGTTAKAKNLGAWAGCTITLDTINQTLTAAPITSITNYQTFTTGPETVITDTMSNSPGTFSGVAYTVGAVKSPHMSVSSTTIYQGANKNLYVNPSIDPRALFLPAQYPILRVTFDSVALAGSSITINGTVYPVMAGRVWITAGDGLSVSGLSVTYLENGHISVSDNERDIDLGVMTNSTISLAGQWYYQCRAQVGQLTEVESVDWDLGHWSIDMKQAIMIYEGLLIAGVLIARYALDIKWLDWIVIIMAGFAAGALFI